MAIVVLTANETGANSLTDINANFADLDTTKADLASPTFTGTPSLPTGTTAVTQSASDNSTKVATTAYVDRAQTVPACRVYQTGAGSTGSSSYTVQDFGAEAFDTDTMHDNSVNPSRITIVTSGKYMVGATITQDTGRASSIQILVDGTTAIATNTSDGFMNPAAASVSTIYDLTAGQYLTVQGSSNGAGTTSGNATTNFWAYKIN